MWCFDYVEILLQSPLLLLGVILWSVSFGTMFIFPAQYSYRQWWICERIAFAHQLQPGLILPREVEMALE